jgi:hypothetical protein
VSATVIAMLTQALHAEDEAHEALTQIAVARLAAEGRAAHAPADLLVAALKRTATSQNGVDPAELSSRYGAALLQLLALYFEEAAE